MLMKLSLMSIMFGCLSFTLYQSHCLSLLISLEAIMLGLLVFLYSFLSLYGDLFWILILLTMAACEAALGLSLLVGMIRLKGNDFTSLMSSNSFFMSIWGQMGFTDASSPIMEEMTIFHDHALVLLIGIFSFVGILGVKLILNKLSSRTMVEAQQLEIIWTVVPALLLIWLALPSLRLLYLLDESPSSGIILKATGHQWYWSYELPLIEVEIDSYMIPEGDLAFGDHRLLEVDNRVEVPYKMNTTVVTTSADVLHAWALPSAGVKMDAVPGRLNSMGMHLEKPGVFYGQCSEICGANHSFMPIVVEAVSLESFLGN